MPAAESGGFGLACPKKRAAAKHPPLFFVEPRRLYCCGAGVSFATSGRGPRGGLGGFDCRAAAPRVRLVRRGCGRRRGVLL